MTSIIKKIFITVAILAALFFWTNPLSKSIQQQTKNFSEKRQASTINQPKPALAEDKQIVAERKQLDVPLLNQMTAPQLYNGCEVTSLAMILNFNGYTVTKNELADKLKTVPLNYQNGLKGNPNEGFVGDIVYGPGYAVYNGPIYDLAKEYAGNRTVNLTGSPFANVLQKVSNGQPVWVITTISFTPVSDFQNWPTPQGTIEVTFSEHSAVITGYDENFIFVNDPYGEKDKKVDRTSFEKAWKQMGSQAIVIEK